MKLGCGLLIGSALMFGGLAGSAANAAADSSSYAQWALSRLYENIQTGYRIAPVPLKTQGTSWTSVGLGSYLVNAVAGCSDCHTNPPYASGGNPFLGQPKHVNAAAYLAGGQPFGPGVVSRNITPDHTGKPAGLSLAQFVHVMRTGEDPQDPGTLLQVMPWPDFQSMSDTDLAAIYSYLQTIPSRPNNY